MNQIVKNRYQITFESKVVDFKLGMYHMKCVETSNLLLTDFLNGWKSANEINELLIPDITDIITGNAASKENGSEAVLIDITASTVYFYDSYNEGVFFELPFDDFNEIVIGWRTFLTEQPYHMSKL